MYLPIFLIQQISEYVIPPIKQIKIYLDFFKLSNESFYYCLFSLFILFLLLLLYDL